LYALDALALCQAKLLVPENSEIDLFQLDGIPMFNEHDERRPPSSVVELKKRIRSADAVLIVTPEYNYSIPGVLNNEIDWFSRPHGDSAWSGKSAAIMGVSLGAIGTARARQHLRQIFVALNLFLLDQAEVVIADAAHRFNEDGNLIDEPTKQLIQELPKNLRSSLSLMGCIRSEKVLLVGRARGWETGGGLFFPEPVSLPTARFSVAPRGSVRGDAGGEVRAWASARYHGGHYP
jgi:chromate reductase